MKTSLDYNLSMPPVSLAGAASVDTASRVGGVSGIMIVTTSEDIHL